ncbi:MAG: SpoIID/LytB domain-containing protein, partial [Blastocatellia bacterium]
MKQIETQPVVSVGLMSAAESLRFELKGEFVAADGNRFRPGDYQYDAGNLKTAELRLEPAGPSSSFVVRDVVIGVEFHWQRKQDQEFRGALRIRRDGNDRLIVINDVPVESYLASVISSEMSASAQPELLKAHAIISRSWLLAQIEPWKKSRLKPSFTIQEADGEKQLIRWYDRENHTGFDVCADDHCQRYQGVTKAASQKVDNVIRETFGRVLAYDDELCDARYSKSCGGMTEGFDAAWEDVER